MDFINGFVVVDVTITCSLMHRIHYVFYKVCKKGEGCHSVDAVLVTLS